MTVKSSFIFDSYSYLHYTKGNYPYWRDFYLMLNTDYLLNLQFIAENNEDQQAATSRIIPIWEGGYFCPVHYC